MKVETIDPFEERDWYSLWMGFVIGLGRPDLANYDHYMELGFPIETWAPKRT